MLTKSLALELAEHRINVNAVSPGAILTEMNSAHLSVPEVRARLLARIPWNRLGDVDDCVGAAVFLASPESDYMPGTGAGIDSGKGRVICGQRSPRRVESVDKQLIQSEVCHNNEAVVRRDVDRVRVRRLLPCGIYTGTGVLRKCGRLPQPAVFFHRKHRDASTAVIRH